MELTKIQSHDPHYIDLKRINDESIIVDAGAMLGIFEENLRATPQGKNCRIIILECDSSLKKAIEDKHIRNTTIIERALCGQHSPAKKSFSQVVGLPGWGSFFERKLSRGAREKCKGFLSYSVKTLRINDIFSTLRIERIDYFKIDIMGAEKEVMETMSQETALRIKQIDIKFFNSIAGMKKAEGIERLIDLGFEIESMSSRQVYGWRK